RPADGRRRRLRRGRARRDVAGDRRLRDLPAPAPRRDLGAGPDVDRAGRPRRPRHRPRRRRRRLPGQALRLRRAAGPPPCPRPPRHGRAPAGDGGGRPPPRPRHPPGLARGRRDRSVLEGVHPSGDLHAPRRLRLVADPAARAGLGVRLRTPLERGRGLRPLPAAQGRPALRTQVDRDGAWRRVPIAKGRGPLSRLSIRLRLTLVFAAVIALVLAATGVFVFLQFEHEANNALDSGLRSRADELSAAVRQSGSRSVHDRHLVGKADSFAEVLDTEGNVLDSSLTVGDTDLLDPTQLRRAAAGDVFVDRGPLPGTDGGVRLLATPVEAPTGTEIVVVGASTASREESFTDLLQLLLVGLPAALILASIAGYGVATAALRPVEAMRARAEEISTAAPDERLPAPATSCARRWRSSAPSSSSPSPRAAPRRSCAPPSPRPRRRPTGSPSFPT